MEIEICRWNGSGYDPDWSLDYFEAASLPYDPDEDVYTVYDVDYCIAMARSTTDEYGACVKFDHNGNFSPDEDMCVFVDEL